MCLHNVCFVLRVTAKIEQWSCDAYSHKATVECIEVLIVIRVRCRLIEVVMDTWDCFLKRWLQLWIRSLNASVLGRLGIWCYWKWLIDYKDELVSSRRDNDRGCFCSCSEKSVRKDAGGLMREGLVKRQTVEIVKQMLSRRLEYQRVVWRYMTPSPSNLLVLSYEPLSQGRIKNMKNGPRTTCPGEPIETGIEITSRRLHTCWKQPRSVIAASQPPAHHCLVMRHILQHITAWSEQPMGNKTRTGK